jgi:hypothetical protein
MSERDYISPYPRVWHEVHKRLTKYWMNEMNQNGVKPPVPLILAGWNFSDNWQKKARWDETINWANEHSCMHLIPELTNEEKYYG